MSQNANIQNGYKLGSFLGKLVSDGTIYPDLQLNNIGSFQGRLVINDYPDAEKILIPDELSSHIIDRFSSSVFPLFEELPDYTAKSSFIAGFLARGGILADIILSNCRNNGFDSLMFFDKKPRYTFSNYDPDQPINNCLVINLIKEWCATPVDQYIRKYQSSLADYGSSPERHSMSTANHFYLDRHYYALTYCGLPDEQLPIFYFNTGCSAYRHDHKYRAYGILKKTLPMLIGKWKAMNKACKYCLNKTIHMKKLNSEFTSFIDEHLDMDYFELSWILDDLDFLSNK